MIRINLLPVREERRKADLQQQLVMLAAGVLAAFAIAASTHVWVRGQIADAEARTKSLEAQLERFKPQQAQVEEFKAKKADIEKKLAVIDGLERSRSGPVRIMDSLAENIPERVWLTSLSADGESLVLAGVSLDNELVASFMTALSASPYFAEVELEETSLRALQDLRVNTFRIRVALVDPGAPDDEATETSDRPAPAGRQLAARGSAPKL